MLSELRNKIDFFIRSKTKFSRKNYVEKDVKILERIEFENLYLLDVLNRFFKKNYTLAPKILDIGCKNWYYAKAEYNYFKSFADIFSIDGVEIDAYRLYSNFYSRFEVAKYHTRNLENTNYIAGDLLNINEKYDYIIWILPFVTPEPLKNWGLPKKYFCPKELLKHAFNLLNKNGQMLILNQGEEEAKIQKSLLDELKIKYQDLGKIESKFFEYKYPRFGFSITKETA